MAYTSHSIANPSFTHTSRKLPFTTDLLGNTLEGILYKLINVPEWSLITSASKVGDFKEQDYIRTFTPKDKISYYKKIKMNRTQAIIKSKGVHSSHSISESLDAAGGHITKTLASGRSSWSSTCAFAVGASVGTNGYVIQHSLDGASWVCTRTVLGFDLSGLHTDATYTKACIRVWTTQAASARHDIVGWTIKPVRWTGGANVAVADYEQFDTNYQSTTATTLTASGDGNEYNEVEIDGTLLAWMNANPNGDLHIMLRGALDYGEDGLDGTDPTGVNDIIIKHDGVEVPELYLEYTSAEVPKIGVFSDRDGDLLSGTASIKIAGIHTSSFRDPSVAFERGKWNHNNSASVINNKAYQNNFLVNSGEEGDWQFCYSASYKGDGSIDDHNSELTIVGQNKGWNFKVKKDSIKHLKNVLNFKKDN